jgi:hypothetical protein
MNRWSRFELAIPRRDIAARSRTQSPGPVIPSRLASLYGPGIELLAFLLGEARDRTYLENPSYGYKN